MKDCLGCLRYSEVVFPIWSSPLILFIPFVAIAEISDIHATDPTADQGAVKE